MAKTGRPKIPGESVYVRLSPDVAESLNDYIERISKEPIKITKTSVINFALKRYLDEMKAT